MKGKDSPFFKLALLISCATHFLFLVIFPDLKIPLKPAMRPQILEVSLIKVTPVEKKVAKKPIRPTPPKASVKRISRPTPPKLPSRNLPQLISEELATPPPKIKSESFTKIPLSPPEIRSPLEKKEEFIPPSLDKRIDERERYLPEEKELPSRISPVVKEEFSYEGKEVEYEREVSFPQIEGPVAKRGILRSVKPTYPEWAEKQGVRGEVVLKFWVLSGGEVANIEILRTSGWAELDECAAKALKKWRFQPIEKEVIQWGKIPFKFEL